MKLTLRLIENLRKLVAGDALAYSAIPKSIAEPLVREGALSVEYHGSRRRLRTPNPGALIASAARYNESLRDLDAAERMLLGDCSRAEQAALTGNSKTRSERSCPGFLVNSYQKVECSLNGWPFTVEPPQGSAVYVSDWETFVVPSGALIVGVENMENFLQVRQQEWLLRQFMKPDESSILFVARYALSSDLGKWLERIPNRYIHFGDFDLAGIDIFLNQFLPYVGDRGSFLIPSDIDQRLRNGSRQRYDDQYAKYANLRASEPSLNYLISLIHHYRRGYDQEGYIQTNLSITDHKSPSKDIAI